MIKLAKIVGLTLLGVLMVALGIWSVLAIFYSGHVNDFFRTILAGAFAVFTLCALAALFFRRWRWRMAAVHFLSFFAIAGWWFSIEPSNARDWQTEVAVLPYATIAGDIVNVHNIRNFDYRTETDFTPAYYDKRFDLRRLEGVDLVASYWMGPHIAHVFLSFAFEGGDYLAISIETRKEKSEGFSTIKGFFRQYELYYVVADERDVIRVRTNYREPREDVYVYRLHGSIDNARRLFLEYIKRINSLKDKPEFYNTLTTNCTTTIWLSSRVNPSHLPFSWKILASGHIPEYLYEHGRLETHGLPFDELQRMSHINARALPANDSPDFSRRIRNYEDAGSDIQNKH